MKFIALLMACLALAAPASAQDYRVDVFGGTVDDRALLFDGGPFATTSEVFYGISVDRLDAFIPNLDIGLEYNSMQYNFTVFPPNKLRGDSFFVTTSYGFDVAPGFELCGTAGLGLTRATYQFGTAELEDTVSAGYVGLGARYSFDAFSLFAEYRSQSTLEEAVFFVGGADREVNLAENLLLIGVGFSF